MENLEQSPQTQARTLLDHDTMVSSTDRALLWAGLNRCESDPEPDPA